MARKDLLFLLSNTRYLSFPPPAGREKSRSRTTLLDPLRSLKLFVSTPELGGRDGPCPFLILRYPKLMASHRFPTKGIDLETCWGFLREPFIVIEQS